MQLRQALHRNTSLQSNKNRLSHPSVVGSPITPVLSSFSPQSVASAAAAAPPATDQHDHRSRSRSSSASSQSSTLCPPTFARTSGSCNCTGHRTLSIKIKPFASYPVDPGFCRPERVRSSFLQVSWKWIPHRFPEPLVAHAVRSVLRHLPFVEPRYSPPSLWPHSLTLITLKCFSSLI